MEESESNFESWEDLGKDSYLYPEEQSDEDLYSPSVLPVHDSHSAAPGGHSASPESPAAMSAHTSCTETKMSQSAPGNQTTPKRYSKQENLEQNDVEMDWKNHDEVQSESPARSDSSSPTTCTSPKRPRKMLKEDPDRSSGVQKGRSN